jgi:hypothetical protein
MPHLVDATKVNQIENCKNRYGGKDSPDRCVDHDDSPSKTCDLLNRLCRFGEP